MTNQPNRYVVGTTGTDPDEKQPVRVGGYDLVALGLFAIAGAILGLAVAVTYIGLNLLNIIGAQWHWIWQVARV